MSDCAGNHYFSLHMKKLFLPLIFLSLPATGLHAQLNTATSDWLKLSENRVLDLGLNGIAVVGSDPSIGANIARFDAGGAAMWTKNYPLGGTFCYFASNADGNDLYVLDFKKEETNGGGKNQQLIRIDAATGTSVSKNYSEPDFGFVLSMYANKKYFFVCTTKYSLDDNRIENDHSVKLYRFDRQTLEMKSLDHQMSNASDDPRVFWQFIRVEDDFVEGYIVNEADQKVTLTLARFDNDGKKISTKETTLMLKTNMARQSNGMMPLAPGISRGTFGQNYAYLLGANDFISIMIYPMCSCYLQYDVFSKAYYAYGLCGPGEQKKIATRYTGYYVAKMDTAFKQEAFKESASVPVLTGDNQFVMNTTVDKRYLSGYFTATGEFSLIIGTDTKSYQFYISEKDLITKFSGEMKESNYAVFGNKIGSSDHFLVNDPDVTSKAKKSSIYYLATATRQYAVLIPSSGKEITVLSGKME